ncbi:MAG TPA: hypothetical protein VJP40_02030, partial [bacterium]|nr:hypothetical protein [bacterium]
AEDTTPVYSGETGDKLIPDDESDGLGWGLEADFVSQYVWRGIALSEGPVLQPSLWLSYQGAIFSVWGNYVLNDEANQGQLNEVDFTFTYSRRHKHFFFGTLLYFYLYPNQDTPATAEASAILGLEWGDWKVFTAQHVDVIATPGAYFGVFGTSYERELNAKLSLKTVAGFGWADSSFNQANFDVSKFAANLFAWKLELHWLVKDPLYLRSHMKVSVLLDEALRDSVDDPTIISGGLAVGVEF